MGRWNSVSFKDIGGNDVANSFATSVGAKALTMKQTIIIASICEFSGAMLLGSHVTATIKGGIVVGSLYKDDPNELMFGMLTVVFGCAVWLIVATFWALPVSSTHTCIGGMLGMAIVSKGLKAVQWKMVLNVILSWFYTPVIAGIISYCLFVLVRKYILKSENSFERSLSFFSPMIGLTLALNFFVILYNGCPWLPFKLTIWEAVIWSVDICVFITIALHFLMVPRVRKNTIKAVEEEKLQEQLVKNDAEKQDVFSSLKNDETVAAIHDKAEVYETKTEKVFVILQVLAAILNSFAHGANDVSHSIGPFAACIAIYQTGKVDDTSPSPAWILAFGAFGIILGLATMGYKVMATVGVNLVTVTPCRGFFIELGASVVVIIGSRIGLPLSTTQCKIGSAVGVGLVGGSESVNWKLSLKIFSGWVATIFVAAFASAVVMKIGMWIMHMH